MLLPLRIRNESSFSETKVKLSLRSDIWYFVRSGAVFHAGDIVSGGIGGYSWMSRAITNPYFEHSFRFGFASLDNELSGFDLRWFGFPLRCLVR